MRQNTKFRKGMPTEDDDDDEDEQEEFKEEDQASDSNDDVNTNSKVGQGSSHNQGLGDKAPLLASAGINSGAPEGSFQRPSGNGNGLPASYEQEAKPTPKIKTKGTKKSKELRDSNRDASPTSPVKQRMKGNSIFRRIEIIKKDTLKIKTNPKYKCVDDGSGDDDEDLQKNEDY
jgi:hypothetical protein